MSSGGKVVVEAGSMISRHVAVVNGYYNGIAK